MFRPKTAHKKTKKILIEYVDGQKSPEEKPRLVSEVKNMKISLK